MFYSVSLSKWVEDDHDKPHTACGLGPRGTWNATVVRLPPRLVVINDKLVVVSPRIGVRIEATELRTTVGDYTLPGLVWFYHFKHGTVSEQMPPRFVKHFIRTKKEPHPAVAHGDKVPGVPLDAHRLSRWIKEAVYAAEESLEAHRQAV